MAEHGTGKLPLPALTVTAYTAKRGKKRKTEEEKKESKRQQHVRRDQNGINIGYAFTRWRTLRDCLGLTLDAQLAVFLLDR